MVFFPKNLLHDAGELENEKVGSRKTEDGSWKKVVGL